MISVYYLDNSITFLTREEYAGTSPAFRSVREVGRNMCSAEQLTNLDEFSGKSKRVLMVCDSKRQVRERFESFSAGMNLISAAGGLVWTPTGEVLMIFRNRKWDLPKGKLEEGETIAECAVREVEEECSISGVQLREFICDTYHLYKLGDNWAIKQTSWFDMSHSGQGRQVPQRIEGITKVRWVPREDLAPYLAETYNTIRDVFTAAGVF